MSGIFGGVQRCEDLTFCSSELSQAYLDLAQELGDDDINGDHADDATWILSASFIILTMQSGFGLLEMGSAVAGNEVNIMMKNAADVIFGSLAYYLFGYGISFGKPSIPFMGMGDFAPDGANMESESGLLYSRYIFQFSFAATATTIVSGMVAMRMRFFVYCFFSFVAIIAYAFPAHWIWASDGWLNAMGAYDFAGAGPVHVFGGMNGLVAIYMLGPRTGRFDGTRKKSDFRPVSQTSMMFGLFMLWWGWIGFNCGSTFGITGTKWIVATRAAITTVSSTGAGGAVAIAYSMYKTNGKMVQVEDVVNGILGSLVTSSAVCSVIHTYESLLLGAGGALVALVTNKVVLRMHLDDVVGAVGVHLGAGVWGLIGTGLFADGNLPGVEIRSGLFRGGGMHLLGLQVLLIVVIISWAFLFSSIFFYLTGVAIGKDWKNPRSGLRVSREEEECGADAYLHGVVLLHEESLLHEEGDEDGSSFRTNGLEAMKRESNDVEVAFGSEERKDVQIEATEANSSSSRTFEETSDEGKEAGKRNGVIESLPLNSGADSDLEVAARITEEQNTAAAIPPIGNESGRVLNEQEDDFDDNIDVEAAVQTAARQVSPAGTRRSIVNGCTAFETDRRKAMMKAASQRRRRESMRVLM